MDNNRTNMKNELITLILADMRNRKLIMGLDATGLSTDDFNTNLSELIFAKIGVEKKYEIHMSSWYEDAIFKILDIDLNAFREHQLFLAITFYDALQEENRKLQIQVKSSSKPEFSFLKWTGFRSFDN